MNLNNYSFTLLLSIIANLFLQFTYAKGGGGKGISGSSGVGGGGFGGTGGGAGTVYVYSSGGGSKDPFFRYVDGRRICTTVCVIVFVLLSIFVAAILVCICCVCCRKYNIKKFHQMNQNSTDGGESGVNNNINRNEHDDSLPPSYESTNPAPDPSYKCGAKHEATSISFLDACEFSRNHPPNENLPTPEVIEDMIMQDGYKAWKFTSEDNISKAQRVLITDNGSVIEFRKKKRGFKYDDVMIQTNYPFFAQDSIQAVNSKVIELDIVHYFEVTLLNKVSNDSTVAIGVTTKPYPYFRLPGWNKNSVGFHSDDGRKFWNDEFGGRSYGPNWGKLGEVIGCGYKPKTGEIFFTKNGNFLGIAFAGLRNTWYPTIGSDGNVKMRINFGDEEFIYKDAQGFGTGAPGRNKS